MCRIGLKSTCVEWSPTPGKNKIVKKYNELVRATNIILMYSPSERREKKFAGLGARAVLIGPILPVSA